MTFLSPEHVKSKKVLIDDPFQGFLWQSNLNLKNFNWKLKMKIF